MASSRQMRGRRLPSPTKNIAPQGRPTVKSEMRAESVNGEALDEEWEEPALRTPAPSFEDYKGLERHGVLEHMAPLGHGPGQKLKAKMRYQETGPRGRSAQVKIGEAKIVRDDVSTPEPAQRALSPRRSEPRKQEPSSKRPASREEDEDGDYEPGSPTKTTPASPVTPGPLPSVTNGTSASHPSTEARDKLKEVIIKATKRAHDTGNPALGYAIQQLYEESIHSQRVLHLLESVLAQKQTPEQLVEFQAYIKAAKKTIKHGKGDVTKSIVLSNSVSQSPGKNGRTSVTRQSRTLNDTSAPAPNHHHSPPIYNAGRPHMNHSMVSNGSPSKDERPAKRLKRTDSAHSSSSDLSSVDSQIENFAPEEVSTTHAPNENHRLPPQRTFQTGPKPSLGPRLGPFKPKKKHLDPNRHSATEWAQHPAETAADNEYVAKRRKLAEQKAWSDYTQTESSIRPVRRDLRPIQTVTPVHMPSHRTPQPQSRLRNGTAQRNKRYDDDDDALSSPPSSPGDLLIPPPAGASRGGTPSHLGRHLKPVKKAKVKHSPLKKTKGVTAGVARLVDTDTTFFGHRRPDDHHDHENSDACASCSGSGQLLCCDGCDRAFHFTCLDPPMDCDTSPDGEWHCIKCLKSQGHEFPSMPRGVFRELRTDINAKNPSAFNLPQSVRDYFDGVKTGEEGEYEETTSVKAKKAHGGGYEENPNNLKLRDSKDNAILCFRCGKSAMGKNGLATRELAACDFCPLSWHLDCLDPPLASAPNKKSTNGKPRHTWMCPAHIDDELQHLDPSLKMSNTSAKGISPATSRFYRVRRPKHTSIIDIGLRRGFRNNGLIEIENDPSDEEIEIDKELSGAIPRLQEKGIKLDFIERVNRMNAEEAQAKQKATYHNTTTQTHSKPLLASSAQARLDELPFAQRRGALLLAQFAHSDGALSSDGVRNLIQTLTTEASTEVEKLVTDAEAREKDTATVSLIDQQVKDLDALIELAQRQKAVLRKDWPRD